MLREANQNPSGSSLKKRAPNTQHLHIVEFLRDFGVCSVKYTTGQFIKLSLRRILELENDQGYNSNQQNVFSGCLPFLVLKKFQKLAHHTSLLIAKELDSTGHLSV
jgi:hypothetical protein